MKLKNLLSFFFKSTQEKEETKSVGSINVYNQLAKSISNLVIHHLSIPISQWEPVILKTKIDDIPVEIYSDNLEDFITIYLGKYMLHSSKFNDGGIYLAVHFNKDGSNCIFYSNNLDYLHKTRCYNLNDLDLTTIILDLWPDQKSTDVINQLIELFDQCY